VFRALGRPFWLAGSFDSPERVVEALDIGAAGVQVGTAFAFCEESGLATQLKHAGLEMCRRGTADVFTDPVASPTGFPFKVLSLPETLSDADAYPNRPRRCDLGYLRHAYKKPDGSLGWRCPAERVDAYVAKGGKEEDTAGRKCLCNALLANVGLGQLHDTEELPLVTCGDSIRHLLSVLPSATAESYCAQDVVDHLLSGFLAVSMGDERSIEPSQCH
jgi:nitronate monooxygenase